jgi:hypothetical protein
MSRDESVIPFIEGGVGSVTPSYVIYGHDERGFTPFMNTEDIWLDK